MLDARELEVGMTITAFGERGRIVSIDGDNVTVAWDKTRQTTQPLEALGEVRIVIR